MGDLMVLSWVEMMTKQNYWEVTLRKCKIKKSISIQVQKLGWELKEFSLLYK